jgi:hypothetical protein
MAISLAEGALSRRGSDATALDGKVPDVLHVKVLDVLDVAGRSEEVERVVLEEETVVLEEQTATCLSKCPHSRIVL